MGAMRRFGILAVGLMFAGCGEAAVSEPVKQAPVVATPVSEPVTEPVKQPAARQPVRAATERPATRSVGATEQAAHAAFMAEMQVGRTQTKGKAYAEAIAAFDRALLQEPQQPRALAERGYAKLLAKDLAGARQDLEAARERSGDPQRLGPIWFNLGLVEEAAGDAEAARRAFARSNELRPGKAVQAKLAGASACTAEIDRTPVAGMPYVSWKNFYDAMKVGDEGDEEAPSETRAIQEAMCLGEKQKDEPLWDLCFYPTSLTNYHSSELVGPAQGRGLVHYGELGSSESGACQNSGTLTVTRVGSLLHARWVEFGRDWEAIPKAQRDADCEAKYEDCELECRDLSARVDDYIIDPAGAERILRVRRTTNSVPRPADPERLSVEPGVIEAALPVRVEVTGSAVTLRGGGCEETIAVAGVK